jgi:hypothetical protein
MLFVGWVGREGAVSKQRSAENQVLGDGYSSPLKSAFFRLDL